MEFLMKIISKSLLMLFVVGALVGTSANGMQAMRTVLDKAKAMGTRMMQRPEAAWNKLSARAQNRLEKGVIATFATGVGGLVASCTPQHHIDNMQWKAVQYMAEHPNKVTDNVLGWWFTNKATRVDVLPKKIYPSGKWIGDTFIRILAENPRWFNRASFYQLNTLAHYNDSDAAKKFAPLASACARFAKTPYTPITMVEDGSLQTEGYFHKHFYEKLLAQANASACLRTNHWLRHVRK
jgi:hypothetical protein